MTITQATVKRLFAESGNVCAFPKCTSRLIHTESGAVVGELCHIKAKNPGGPRYDPNQTPDERDGYDNLILLCQPHHTVIDDDPESYTVDRLVTMKTTHRGRQLVPEQVDDQLIARLATNKGARAEGGSNITTINQQGGQVAHTITNLGPPKRVLSETQRSQMLRVLAQVSPSQIGFASTQGDIEAHEFKQQLMAVFQEAKWAVQDMSTFMFFGATRGLVVTIGTDMPEQGLPQVVASALAKCGNPIKGNRGSMADDVGIYVQVWHAP